MFNFPFQIAFDRPIYLWLLLLVPVLWYLSYDSLAGLGKWRRMFALLFRTVVVAALVLALAHTKWELKTDRLTVIYLLDQSQSIPKDIRQSMVDYVITEVDTHRREEKKDRAGLIVFGANAKIESAPFDGRLPILNRLEAATDIDGSSTSLEAALKLAKASFNEDSARRIVIISDGNENLGDARAIAKSMAEEGIGIDAIGVELSAKAEISVMKVIAPTDVRKDEEFQTTVVINNESAAGEEGQEVSGTLRLVRKLNQGDGEGQREQLIAERKGMKLVPGKNIIGFDSQLDSSGIFATEAVFIPDDRNTDLIPQNNKASTFTRVEGKGKVLLIEDAFAKGEFNHLADRLRANSIEVVTIDSSKLFNTQAELLQYDAVILANLPRSSGFDGDESAIAGFSDAQVKMLVDNCEKMGCGILMLGGDRAFGAGGWSNTLLEEAMPVSFQIKNDKVQAVGALAMVMHACEMPNGNHWQVKVGEAALDVLGPADYCGVVQYDQQTGIDKWLWTIPKSKGGTGGVDLVSDNKRFMLRRINNMAAGDMPNFDSSMRLMLNGLLNVKNAAIRHAIIISDGDPNPPSNKLLAQFKKNRIRISTVGVGTHGAPSRKELLRIANATGGKFWNVTDAKALPKIYQREARRVAKPVIKESDSGMSAIPVAGTQSHEILKGIDVSNLPGFYGYVMTTIKTGSLVEQLAIASEPQDDDGENSTLLASWRYGNGRSVVFTSDAGHRWTNEWFGDDQYDKLFVQMVRYAMRPITEIGDFTVSTEVKDGVSRIVVTAINEDEEFLNFLEMNGTGIYSGDTEDDNSIPLNFNQIGPGRYVAEHEIKGSGSVLYSIFPGEGYKKLTAGVTVPSSNEYSDREANLPLLKSLASLKPKGGEEGIIMEKPISPNTLPELLEENTFRPTLSAAISIQDIWPFLLMFGAAIFFSDVFVRRVSTSFWASMLAFLTLVPVAIVAYFGWKMFVISRSFDTTESIFLGEPSMPLLVTILLAMFAAFYLAFALSSERTEEWVKSLKSKLLRRENEAPEESISRLRSRKAEVEKEIESRRAATRFAPEADDAPTATGEKRLEQVLASEIEKTPALPPKIKRDEPADEEGSYTSRLLDAKRKVQQRQKRNKDDDV